jgi:hypothetical protein
VRRPGLPPQSGPLGAIACVARALRCEASLVSLPAPGRLAASAGVDAPRCFVSVQAAETAPSRSARPLIALEGASIVCGRVVGTLKPGTGQH